MADIYYCLAGFTNSRNKDYVSLDLVVARTYEAESSWFFISVTAI